MKSRDNPDVQVWQGDFPGSAADAAAADFFPWVWSDSADSGHAFSAAVTDASFLSPNAESDGLQDGPDNDVVALVQGEDPDGNPSHSMSDTAHISDAAPAAAEGSSTPPAVVVLPMTASALSLVDGAYPLAGFVAGPMPEAASASLFVAPAHADYQMFITGLPAAAAPAHGDASVTVAAVLASLTGPAEGFSGGVTDASVGLHGATAAQLQQALDESASNANGAGIKVGVLSDSFNDLGGYASDEADGALPAVQVLSDLSSGGTDEGRAMLQIVHDIAPNASLAFYTADEGEQAFANGILALAAAGCKVICDDVAYLDEPFFGGGVIAQAIQTVEQEGVTYITSAGNNASNGYQAAWTPTSGSFDGWSFTDAQNFGGSVAQTVTVTASSATPVWLMLEWNKAYGQANFNSGQAPDIDMFVFHNGSLIAQETNASVDEANNPVTGYEFTASGTYQIVITNNFGPDPGLIKEIAYGDGLPVTISGANAGTVFGHGLTPGVITVGAVSTADTPAFGFSTPVSESFSSSGAGSELLYADDGTALSSPEAINPVDVSSVDNIATTVSGGLSDFYGTSAASASLAGVAALILAANPDLTPAQVEQIMEETATPMSNSSVSGAGLVNVDAAVAAAEALLTKVIESFGSTSLVETGGNFYLDAISSGTGPELKYNGTNVVAGEFGAGWAAIGAEQTSTGYEVAWKEVGADEYTIWTTDSSGNYLANVATGSGTSAGIETAETILHQDLNGDGVIGVPTTVIESFGSTSLVQAGSNYFLYANGTSIGPELKNGGSNVVVGGSGSGWAPIAAEQTSTGYEIAWKLTGADQYTVWTTDSDGNYLASIATGVGKSAGIETAETVLHQDLNGDGVIGIPTTVIESLGSTSLVEVGSNFYLDAISSGTGPELKGGGVAVIAGQSSGWAPIGAEQISTGYEVAWKLAGADQYSIWQTDSSGNYLATVATASGTNAAIETAETVLHQDLNGDGVIGIPTTVIESFGSTSLVEVGSNFYLDAISSGTGPELQGAGVAVIAGQSGGWAPIGAEQISTGYEVAWKLAGADQYSVWTTDNSGNYISSIVGTAPGASAAIETAETVLHQDLNGDGVIGFPTTAIESIGSTGLTQVGSNYYLDAISSGTGPELKNGGANVVVGGSGSGWMPIGAEQTSTGYELAWKLTGADEYTVWTTDSSGNYLASIATGAGKSAGIETAETVLHQDLNGDGVIGVPSQHAVAASVEITAAMASTTNDTFVFNAAHVENAAAYEAPANTIDLSEFSHAVNNVSNNEPVGFAGDPHSGYLQTLFQSANSAQHENIGWSNHDASNFLNAHHAELMHAYMIH